MGLWEYGELYRKYNMDGEIKIGTGMVKVHDIFEPLPEFMKEADAVFCDPPCSRGNLTSFYTKAGMVNEHEYADFYKRFFGLLKEINPAKVFVEVFKSNYNIFKKELESNYRNVIALESMYYRKEKNKCWILLASNEEVPEDFASFPLMDEEDIIKFICQNVDFECIADPCMGKGLVAFYANKYGRKFVGTELNPKRLAVCLERVNTGKIGKIK